MHPDRNAVILANNHCALDGIGGGSELAFGKGDLKIRKSGPKNMTIKKRIPKLLVVFDTNVLFTQAASDLVRSDTQRIIEENSTHLDLEIVWHLPEVVVGERKYQMLGKATEFLPNMQKLERLLGHKFGVGVDTLELHVDKAISDSIDKYKLKTIGINASDIDWDNLIKRSTNRLPPFEPGAKEKGFRDSIIAHSFFQLHKSSPTTPSVCRLAIVSEDQRLREYITELTAGSNNVRILKSLDELESLINTLVSTIPEDFAEELSRKAKNIFFEEGNEKTFYYKEKISDKISKQYAKELSDTIIPSHIRTGGTWYISEPIFIKKDRQKVYWVSPIEPEFEIFHYEQEGNTQSALASIADFLKVQTQSPGEKSESPPPHPAQRGLAQGLLGSALSRKKVVDLKGREKFEVHWSANLTQAQNLSTPKLEKIQYMGNNITEG